MPPVEADEYDDGADPEQAWPLIRRRVAALQLLPYHSKAFGLPSCLANLPSVDTVKRYVREELLPRARRGATLLVVARVRQKWLDSTVDAETRGILLPKGRNLSGQLSATKPATRRIARFLAEEAR